ncbi:LEAF RUST 10 DISEASE-RESISTANCEUS RECEPTOR-LIKE PROTEIN KINASE-like 2.8 isoform X2 [Medicago truncatula]|uniref:LEAF RUST 10 DISEASE-RESISTANCEUS RECEPTOR-LIKE PROTEIN KINASE-like 2.8 isoform X2 n=1 Tax=Medicago truncatula TaxID=3880 RepID=UPI000D2F23C6|nr:LEAF RUST 10 DISEASE-RESISTANCE LOCUS RECEPTOR-LIKE PROTEIN KINASE-like 2.8 isoform X2 [Medicago truncatula]
MSHPQMPSPHHLLPFSFIINICLLLSLFLIPIHVTSDVESFKSCAPFSCGNFTNISYPFWSINNQQNYCGHPNFKLDCEHGNLTIEIKSQKFHIIDINQTSQVLRIARLDLWSYDSATIASCPKKYINVTLDSEFFNYTSNYEKYTLLYECGSLPDPYSSSLGSEVSQFISCLIEDKPRDAYLMSSAKVADFIDLGCKNNITIPGLNSSFLEDSDSVANVLDEGFEVKWSGVEEDICDGCMKSGGRCGYNTTENVVLCLCPNQQSYGDCGFCRPNLTTIVLPDDPGCKRTRSFKSVIPPPLAAPSNGQIPYDGQIPLNGLTPAGGPNSKESSNDSGQWNWKRKFVIGVGSAAMVALLMCIIICCYRGKSSILVKFWFKTKNDINIEAFLKDHGVLLQKRYKFSEIKKITNSFKIKVGQGGFGAVYKGKLFNGSLVAVKILNASKGNGEDFINEVASITRTSHVNVVNLLGFCFEGCNKALIYEFMSNGSLDKFIYNKEPETIASLSWDNMHQIAKGIARGLEYLHRGCATRILHFDIKPHNILLDENFCPKISDFGLAKLCLKKDSIVSMSDQRGTMGYVAPEVWNRHFGGVSHKSDVYSYGMMLLEMVGGRKNINADASHTSEIYFPHWVYNRLELGSYLRPDGVMDTEEDEIAKRMTIVSLWCIQTFPNGRPTMSKVVEMLEVDINSLEIPPKPLLSSPTRSVSESCTS